MSESVSENPSLTLVHEGWNHLMRQRPIAARASWLRALRIDPENAAAQDALDRLQRSGDLPLEARVEHRLRSPSGESRRKRWDILFRERDLSELQLAAETFGKLVEADEGDSDAWYNQALGLAWQGRNIEAIDSLQESVAIDATSDPSKAVAAWTLAELLRQGGGAEELADDLTYTMRMSGEAVSDPDFLRWFESRPQIQPATLPGLPAQAKVSVWIDRPGSGPIRTPARIQAYLIQTPSLLKLSSPDPVGLELIKDEVESRTGEAFVREASPLSLTMLDAAVWAIRIPTDLAPEEQARLRRSAVENYYENLWITRPRKGLDGRTPLEAAKAAGSDPETSAKLAAVVVLREQIAERPSAIELYQRYPFDRLRRRLGLPLRDPEVPGFEADDPSCMSPAELDALDPTALNDLQLADALESVMPLQDEARSARFGEALISRGPQALAFVDRVALFALLIRRALSSEGTSRALAWLDLADEANRTLQGDDRPTFANWRAEVLARANDPDEACRVFQELVEASPDDPEVPLAAAETLLDRDYPDHARVFAEIALSRAEAVGDERIAHLTRAMLGSSLD